SSSSKPTSSSPSSSVSSGLEWAVNVTVPLKISVSSLANPDNLIQRFHLAVASSLRVSASRFILVTLNSTDNTLRFCVTPSSSTDSRSALSMAELFVDAIRNSTSSLHSDFLASVVASPDSISFEGVALHHCTDDSYVFERESCMITSTGSLSTSSSSLIDFLKLALIFAGGIITIVVIVLGSRKVMQMRARKRRRDRGLYTDDAPSS
ncbi:hypothetical protein BVRB_035540, partial [Beta vulgaris subsp. vulgaris]